MAIDLPPLTVPAAGPHGRTDLLAAQLAIAEVQYPFERRVRLSRCPDDPLALTPGGHLVRRVDGESALGCLVELADAVVDIYVSKQPGGETCLTIAGATAEIADEIADYALALIPQEPEDPAGLTMRFWYRNGAGVFSTRRHYRPDPWSTLIRNYPGADALDRLMRKPDIGPGLILFHGPPGTGKSRAVLALAHALQPVASADVLVEPERVFQDPTYLLALDSGHRTDRPDATMTLLIAEDVDPLVSDATHGPALGRLLSTTDGLLSSNVIALLTTNAAPERLHPAVTRPGRAIATIPFRAFSSSEARAWLGEAAPDSVRDGLTLAELYGYLDDPGRVALSEGSAPGGPYL